LQSGLWRPQKPPPASPPEERERGGGGGGRTRGSEAGVCTKMLQPGTYPTAQPPRVPTASEDRDAGVTLQDSESVCLEMGCSEE